MGAHLEGLRKGSKFHKVSITGDGFTIAAINDSPDCMERFNEIADEAIRNASAENYGIRLVLTEAPETPEAAGILHKSRFADGRA